MSAKTHRSSLIAHHYSPVGCREPTGEAGYCRIELRFCFVEHTLQEAADAAAGAAKYAAAEQGT